MSFVTILAIIALVLFALVFFTKRRFGVLGLAVAAGAMLSSLWASDLTPVVANAGIELVKPPLRTVIAVVLTLVPALVLLPGQGKYTGLWQRFIGSALFAVLAVALLLGPLSDALVIDKAGQPLFELLTRYHAIAIAAGVALALLDILMTKTPKADKPSKH